MAGAEEILIRERNVDHFAFAFARAVAGVAIGRVLGCGGEGCKVVSRESSV